MPTVPPDSKKEPSAPVKRIRTALDGVARRVPISVQRTCFVILAIAYVIVGGARVFDRTLFGIDPQRPYLIVVVCGILFAAIFGPTLLDDQLAREAERKRLEREWEENEIRDPEADAQMRKDIGMTPNNSLERSRER
jgi:hypothetical protein